MKRLLTITFALILAFAVTQSIQSQDKVTRTTKTRTQQSQGSKKASTGTKKATGTTKSKPSVSQTAKKSDPEIKIEISESPAPVPTAKTAPIKEEPSEPDGFINGHGYVDLGLSSGLKWATCNVGSDKPETSHVYFAWGETSPRSYYFNTLTHNKSYSSLESEGIIGLEGNLAPSYDAASTNMGSSWRMPTRNEFQELIEECQWKRIKLKGNSGFLITGPNGKSIFLSYSGYRLLDDRNDVGNQAYYWSSTPISSNDLCSYNLYNNKIDSELRYNGYSVRAVSE